MGAINRLYLERRLAAAVRMQPTWIMPGYSIDEWIEDMKQNKGRESYAEAAARRLLCCSRGLDLDEMIRLFRPPQAATFANLGRDVLEKFHTQGIYTVNADVRKSGVWYAIMDCFMRLEWFMIARSGGVYFVTRSRLPGERVFEWSPHYEPIDKPADDQTDSAGAAQAA